MSDQENYKRLMEEAETPITTNLGESLKRVLEADRCIAVIEVEGAKVAAEVTIPKMKMAEVRRGKYPEVSMGTRKPSKFIPGKTVGKVPCDGEDS